jgi:hypothetical protein
VLVSDHENGLFETDFTERQHPAAHWLDSYFIGVAQATPGSTVVEVLRTVYISRDGHTFNQGASVGHNEAWILTQIGDRLSQHQS